MVGTVSMTAKAYQSINVPRRVLVGDAIGVTVSGSHLLYLGPNIRIATMPVTPPDKCTGPHPAMSIIPKM